MENFCYFCKQVHDDKKWYNHIDEAGATYQICKKGYLKAYHQKNKERINKERREHYANDMEYKFKVDTANKQNQKRLKAEGYKRVRKPRSEWTEDEKKLAYEAKKRWQESNKEKHQTYMTEYRKDYYEKNKDSILTKNREYAQTLEFTYSSCRSGAKRRKIPFELTLEQYKSIVSKKCHYCQGLSIENDVTGIDRLDSDIWYIESNCVACCPRCNYLKGKYISPEEAKAALVALDQYAKDGIIPDKITFSINNLNINRVRLPAYSKLVDAASKNNTILSLTKEDFDLLASQPCYYCGGDIKSSGYSIDKKDPKQGYTKENSVPCCPMCNKIKFDIYTPEETLVIVNAIQKVRMVQGFKTFESKSRGERAYTGYHMRIKEDAYNSLKVILSSASLQLLTSFEEYNAKVTGHRCVQIGCQYGHTFNRNYDRASQILSCPDCDGKSNKNGGYLQKLKANGWDVVEGEYVNKESVLTVCCQQGHSRRGRYRYLRDQKCSECYPSLQI
jgi:hypothetical protein